MICELYLEALKEHSRLVMASVSHQGDTQLPQTGLTYMAGLIPPSQLSL